MNAHPAYRDGRMGAAGATPALTPLLLTGFERDRVYTAVKLYRPQGGFNAYKTDYKWDEAAQKFVQGATFKAGK